MEKSHLSLIEKRSRRSIFYIFTSIIIGVYCLSVIFLLCWGFLSSVKTGADFYDNPFGLPKKMVFSNLIDAFKEMNVPVNLAIGKRKAFLPELFMWSMVYTIGESLVVQLSRCCCAYVCAKYNRSVFSKIMNSIVVFVMVIPISGTLAASIEVRRMIGSYDNLFVGILYTAGFTGQAFLVYFAAFKTTSFSYAEAASIDGANNYVIFFKIMFPMVINMFGGLFLLEFITLWNNYYTPMVYYPSYPTVSYGLYRFQFSFSINPNKQPIRLASTIVVAMPVLILFVIFNKRLVGNISVGGLKG